MEHGAESSLETRLLQQQQLLPGNPAHSSFSKNMSSAGSGYFGSLQYLQSSASMTSIAEIALAYDSGLRTSGQLFGGVIEDMRRRREHFVSDFTEAFKAPRKVLASSLFMFFGTWSSTVALGELVRRQTDGQVGVTEYLLLQGCCGILHALFSSQPLLIVRPTGPVSVFVIQLSLLSARLNFDFYTWFAWVGLWVGFYMLLIASFDGTHYIKFMTRFLHELYETFVCTIYVTEGMLHIGSTFRMASEPALFSKSLFNMLLAVVVVSFALLLSQAPKVDLCSVDTRHLLHEFALPIAIACGIGISYSTHAVDVDRIQLPSGGWPVTPTAYGRPWLASLNPLGLYV
eukprot:g66152.t1